VTAHAIGVGSLIVGRASHVPGIGKLSPRLWRFYDPAYQNLNCEMEAGTNNNSNQGRSLKEVMTAVFNSITPDTSQVLTWKIFQCWTTRDCNFKSDVTNEEIAAFLDQLNLLVE